jgi:hypothetical protein
MPLILRILNRVGVAFYATLLLATALSAADDTVKIRGPEALCQHIAPAQEQVGRFLKFYDLGSDKSAEGLMWKKSMDLQQTRDHFKKFGKFEGRTLHSIRVADTYPPEADATFIIFTYDAKFTEKKTMAQKVVVRLSDKGKYEIAVFP